MDQTPNEDSKLNTELFKNQMSPQMSLRRNRQSPLVRELVSEFNVLPEKLMQPLFVVESLTHERESIQGLPGVFRETSNSLLKQIESDLERGVNKFLLFGVPKVKSNNSFDPEFTSSQIFEIKKRFGSNCFLAVDVCLCSYTHHGQCGILGIEQDHVENGTTVEALTELALSYAQAGADVVAPSDMMDGRIRSIRSRLDQSGYDHTLLLSYSAKFHSSFYGPFRNAADSAPKNSNLKDRSTYQIDPRHPQDAYLSSLRDQQEGADWLMVKPGLPYLDVLKTLSDSIQLPWCVYQVSGEYAAIEELANKGLIHRERAHVEAWTAFFRAGARFVITYGARYAKDFLKGIHA